MLLYSTAEMPPILLKLVSLSTSSTVQIVRGLVSLQLSLQYLRKSIHCSDSKDKLEINKMKGELAKLMCMVYAV